MITVVIDGEPVPQGRPRVTRTGHAYTPEKSRDYKALVMHYARKAMTAQEPVAGPLSVSLVVCRTVPKSWGRKKQEAAFMGKILPDKKPDLDNFVKAVLDGCNGIVWQDDGQITELRAVKKYTAKPCVILNVYPAPVMDE